MHPIATPQPSTAGAAARRRGRPRLASRALLEEAAFELFLEQGFARTTVDEIALRAGVSRNTFFNYFDSKSDVFWVEIDEAMVGLRGFLEQTAANTPVVRAIGEAFADCAHELGQGVVPWILTNYEAIGKPAELMESALRRFAVYSEVLQIFVAERLNAPRHDLLPQVMANTTLAAVASAALAWGAAGVNRGALDGYLLRALAPLAEGFALSR